MTTGTRPATRCSRQADSRSRGELEASVQVARGVTVRWDPARPARCGDVELAEGLERDVDAAGFDHLPWLRLAAVLMFDRHLYLPLDQSLVDAEVAAARLVAAGTLDNGDPIRREVFGAALNGAYAAAGGVAAYLKRLAAEGHRPEPALGTALKPLARFYATLQSTVGDVDRAFRAVTATWDRLVTLDRAAPRRRGVVEPSLPRADHAGAAFIDPRMIRARVLRIGLTPDSAEIDVEPAEDGHAVRVRVEVFSPKAAPLDEVDVGVRLVDRAGGICGVGLLDNPGGHRPHLHGRVTFPSSVSLSDVRVELYDAAEDPRPAAMNTLRQARLATLFLSEWRALVADVRLWGVRARPAARTHATIGRLTGYCDEPDGRPLWARGPSRSQLVALADLGDAELIGLLRRRARHAGPQPEGVLGYVMGPGELLAAEVAAAYERTRVP